MNKGSNGKAMSSAEPPRRLKRKAVAMSSSSSEDDLCSGVSDAMAETRAVTLTEPLRISERRAIRRDDDKTGGGREDNSYSDSDEGYTCTYIGGTNYVALTREGRGT